MGCTEALSDSPLCTASKKLRRQALQCLAPLAGRAREPVATPSQNTAPPGNARPVAVTFSGTGQRHESSADASNVNHTNHCAALPPTTAIMSSEKRMPFLQTVNDKSQGVVMPSTWDACAAASHANCIQCVVVRRLLRCGYITAGTEACMATLLLNDRVELAVRCTGPPGARVLSLIGRGAAAAAEEGADC